MGFIAVRAMALAPVITILLLGCTSITGTRRAVADCKALIIKRSSGNKVSSGQFSRSSSGRPCVCLISQRSATGIAWMDRSTTSESPGAPNARWMVRPQ